MKYIRLEYDKKLCKEKLEKNKKSARQRFLQKICIVICGTGVFFASVRYSLHLCFHRQICEKYYLFRCDVCAQCNDYDIQ